MISKLINEIFEIYWWIIIVRIFLTWIPSINWYSQPFKFMADIVDPLLTPFRQIIPPISGIDFSPIIAIIFLRFLQIAFVQLFVFFGL